MDRRTSLVLPTSPPLPRKHAHHSSWSSPSYSPYSSRPASPLPPLRSSTPPARASTSTLPPDINCLPLQPLPHHLSVFLGRGVLDPATKRQLFTTTLLRAVSSATVETLEWLLSTQPVSTTASGSVARLEQQSVSASASSASKRFSSSSLSYSATQDTEGQPRPSNWEQERLELSDLAPRKWVDLEKRDEEGNTALVLAAALGQADVVRILVEAGAEVGGQDNAGWTPLHWAVQNGNLSIAAYLLNHRASPNVTSHKGLAPRDLIARGRNGIAMREILKSAEEAFALRFWNGELHLKSGQGNEKGSSAVGGADKENVRPESRASVSSTASSSRTRSRSIEAARDVEAQVRFEMAVESWKDLEVDLDVLGMGESPTLDGMSPGAGILDEDEEGIPNAFIWDQCQPDQMLVFSLEDLPILLKVIIDDIKPVRTRAQRLMPANVLFLAARYTHYFGSQEMMDNLFLGALDKIEGKVEKHPNDMANSSFWLSNCLLLLYYLRTEPNLRASTAEYQEHLSALINEIFVFVIRNVEIRVDGILAAAILDYEEMPIDDLQFEGEWGSSLKKLTARSFNRISKSSSALSIFASPSTESLSNSSPPRSQSSLFPSSPPTPKPSSSVPSPPSPKRITSILSSTLFVLQVYEIPPVIIVQAFSQLFYWLSCEIFNRLLTQKKYLCRSRALQVRLNISALEDWARLNRLPPKIVSLHFASLNQLLHWIQSQSSQSSIDGLIEMIQSLKSLNPLQLRRVVAQYRYEVDEPRMDADCAQYLAQIQSQWEKVRQQTLGEEEGKLGRRGAGSPRSASPALSAASVGSEVTKMVDQVFSDPAHYSHYQPPGSFEALGELLNSRFMIPFALPSSNRLLIHFQREAFGPFASSSSSSMSRTPSSSTDSATINSHLSEAMITSTSLSPKTAQFFVLNRSSEEDGEGAEGEDSKFVPIIPSSFFDELDAAKIQAYGRLEWKGLNRSQGVRRGLGLEGGGDGLGVFDWRKGMPTDDDDEDEESEGDGEAEGQRRRQRVAGDDTPRPRYGFARRDEDGENTYAA